MNPPEKTKNKSQSQAKKISVAAKSGKAPTAGARVDQARIDKWVRDRLIDWPPTSCLHCRKPIVPGQLWTVVSNGEVTARFHQDCHSGWLAEQEVAARRALVLAYRGLSATLSRC
jgi:hypothetical protein